MATLALVLSYASGFALMQYPEPPARLIATSLAIELVLAPLTCAIAGRRGRSRLRWGLCGVVFGLWAVAAVMLLPGVGPGAKASVFSGPRDAA